MTTTPVQYDHPDYKRTVANTDIRVFAGQATVGVVSVLHGRFLVGTSPFVQLIYQVSAGGARLTLSWYDGPTGSNLIAVNTVDVLAGVVANGPFPCLGPFLELTSIADAANRTVTLVCWQASVEGNGTPNSFPDNLIVADVVVVGAGATRTDNAASVNWGWGHWVVQMEAATSWLSRLYAVDFQGNTRLIDAVGLGIPAGGRLFFLPANPIRVVTTNFDGVAHNLLLSVNHRLNSL